MILMYLMALTFFLVTGVKLCKRKVNDRFRYELSPRLILVISYCIYSSAMPISRLFFASAETSYDEEYMMAQLLGALGILIGLIIRGRRPKVARDKSSKESARVFQPVPAIILMTLTMGIVIFIALKALEWNFAAIFFPYGYELSLLRGDERPTVFGAIAYLFPISSVVLSFIGARNIKSKNQIMTTLLFAGLFSIFYLLRGSRNSAGMMIISLIGVYFYSKPINIKKLLLFCLLTYFVIYGVGVVRSFGFSRLNDVAFQLEMFDPLKQEFGTNYSVFTKWKETGRDDGLLLGKSYTSDVLINMVPMRFWPDRPPTAATQFSMGYFGKVYKGELTLGLGFSPVVESLMNFGYMGIIPVFALFCCLVTFLESWFMRKGAWGIVCYAFMIPTMINWNRIDMAILLKIFIIFSVVSKIFSMFIFPRSKPELIDGR